MNLIKELRKQRGLSQSQLAKEINISKKTLADWENGRRNPNEYNYKKLSNFFNVPIDTLKAQIVITNDKELMKSIIKNKTNYNDLYTSKIDNENDLLLKIKLDKILKINKNKTILERCTVYLIVLLSSFFISSLITQETTYNKNNAIVVASLDSCSDYTCVFKVEEVIKGSYSGKTIEVFKTLLNENESTYIFTINFSGQITNIESYTGI